MKKLIKIWPYLTILFFVFVFFWKFFLKGLIPLPADITVGMYYPWLDYKWGYQVGVPVKNPVLSDVVSQIFPYKTYALELLKQGQLPLWNPKMFAGFPLLANTQIGIFNPTNILFFFLPVAKAWGLQIALQPLLAAVFTYIFLRFLKLSKLSGLLGGLTYGFSGFIIIWLEWGIHSFAVCFLPILLYFTARFYEEKKIRFAVFFSLFFALQIFSGYPQILIYSGLALALFIVLKYRVWCKQSLFWAGFALLGVGLAGIQLLPTLELYLISQRLTESIADDIAFLPWRNIVTFFAPDFFGNHSTMNFWGMGNYTNSAGYTGIVTLFLTVIGISAFRKNKNILFFITLLTVSLLFAFPTPLAVFIRQIKFFGLSALSATRILFLTNFSLACLASFGFDRLLKERDKTYHRAVYLPLVVVGSVLIACLISQGMFIFQIRTNPSLSSTLSIWINNLSVGVRNLVIPLSLTIFCLLFLVIRKCKAKFFQKTGLFLLFFISILELFRFGWKYLPFTDKSLVFPSTPAIDFLKEQKGVFRVDGGDAIPMNMLMPYGLESLSAYDPVYPLQMAQFLSLADGGSINGPKSRYGKIDTFSLSLVDLANICFVLSVKKDLQGKPDSSGVLSGRFKLKKFEPIFEDKTVVVLKNNYCFPRAWLSRNYLVEEKEKEMASKMTDKSVDLRKIVLLEKDPKVKLVKGDSEENETIDWIARSPNRQELEVSIVKPAILFVSDSYYPGWKAFIDGRQTEIYRADFTFRAIIVPEGKHKIVFEYKPAFFLYGVLTSLFSFLIWSCFLIFDTTKERK